MRMLLALGVAAIVALPLGGSGADPDPRKRALIVELLEVTTFGPTMKATAAVLLEQVEKREVARAEARGELPKDVDVAKRLRAVIREEVTAIDFSAVMKEAAIRVYSKHYTERELAELVAFYRTPTGRKSIEVLPEILRDSAEAGDKSLQPLVDEAVSRALERTEAERQPWRGVMKQMRELAGAIQAYSEARDDSSYPPGDYEALRRHLVPKHAASIPEKDAWGTPFAYVRSANGDHYRIVSAGSDGTFDPKSLRVNEAAWSPGAALAPLPRPELVHDERPGADIIYEDGAFIQVTFPDPAKSRGR